MFFSRCCIHTRDWSVGEMIPDQIVASVHQSRRTLIVLSPEYVACSWTRFLSKKNIWTRFLSKKTPGPGSYLKKTPGPGSYLKKNTWTRFLSKKNSWTRFLSKKNTWNRFLSKKIPVDHQTLNQARVSLGS